jgi:hypothetical protein
MPLHAVRTPTSRHPNRAIPLVTIIVLLLAATLQVTGRSASPIRLSDVSYRVRDLDLDATATISNGRDVAQTIRVWWFLGSVGDREPWRRPAYRSRVIEATISARSTTSVTWREPVAVPSANYAISFWVHDGQGDGFESADGRFGDSALQLDMSPSVLRQVGPDEQVRVLAVDSINGDPDNGYTASVRIGNIGAAAVDVVMEWGWTSSSLGSRTSSRTSSTRLTTVPSEATQVVKVDTPNPLAPGSYHLWVRLRHSQSSIVLDDVSSQGVLGI